MRKPVLVMAAVLVAASLSSPAAAQSAPETEPNAPPPVAADAAPRPPAAQAQAQAPVLAPPSFGSPSQQDPGAPQWSSEPGRRLSEHLALGLSLGITLASWSAMVADRAMNELPGSLSTLGALGAALGPSVGHWYRGAILTRGMIGRALGVATLVFVMNFDCDGDSCDTATNIFLGGAALFVLGSADDIITAPLRVRAHNRRLQDVTLTPMVTPHAAGLALGARF